MKNTWVVAADLGGFKAYRINNGQLNRTPRLELVEEFRNAGAHDHLVDKVTDLSGRFPRSTGMSNLTGAMSDGERHNIDLERRKRLVRQLAQRLNSLMKTAGIERCYLAASREINHQLLEELDAGIRARIEKNLPADLTKTDKSELLRHFQPLAQLRSPDSRTFA